MIKLIKLLSIIFFVSSCNIVDSNRYEPEFIIDPIGQVENKKKSNYYSYTDINKTTGAIISQNYHIGSYWSSDDIRHYHIKDNNGNELYRFSPTNSIYFDYNNDGNTDMFAFLIDWAGYEPWINEGRLMLVDDILGKREIKYYEMDVKRVGMMEVNDFNGDGKMDILVSNQDGHDLTHDTDREQGRDFIVYFANDNNIEIQYIGYPSESAITTGDIDNDGDIDIIQNMVNSDLFYDVNSESVIPLFHYNDGAGNFEMKDGIRVFTGLKDSLSNPYPPNDHEAKYYWNTWYSNSIDIYDVDGDGFLDYLPKQPVNRNYEESFSIGGNESRIYWGDGSGIFDMNNYSVINNSPLMNFGEYVEIHSTLLFDFTLDGNNDMINVININHNSWHLQFISNKGNRQFSDVTNEYFNYNVGLNCINGYKMDGFYNLIPFDIDEDGMMEFIPYKENHFIDCIIQGSMYLDREHNSYRIKLK